MHLRARFVGTLAALFTALALTASALADTVVVQMTTVNFEPRFVPSEITVRPGDTVRWINVDPYLLDHSTCNGTGSADPMSGVVWNSGTVRTSEFYEHTFPTEGDFVYYSIPHEFEGMFGVVHVTTSLPTHEDETTTWGRLKSGFRQLIPRD
jgi:plastocyanin